jgi:hypothetical protein
MWGVRREEAGQLACVRPIRQSTALIWLEQDDFTVRFHAFENTSLSGTLIFISGV